MSRTLIFALALTLEFSGVRAWAADDFDAAQAAFNDKNYTEALALFLAIEPGKADSERLNNIAVCHYHLGNWQEANAVFKSLYEQQPDHHRVAYSLAVTEKKLGNIDEARKLFLEVALTSSDDQHAGAAKQQYRELTHQSTNVGKGSAASNWQAMADIRLGGDDNVIDPSDLSGSNTSDSFVETLLTSRWSSDQSSDNRWVADGFVYASRYDEVSEYDIDMLDIGFKKYFKEEFGSWYLGGRADAILLGSTGYQQGLSFNAGLQGKLNTKVSWNADYRFRQIDSLNEEYDPFEGDTQRMKLGLSGQLGQNSRWRLNYRYEMDDLQDASFTDSFTSYSAQRHGIGASINRKFGDWRTSLTADYRVSDYLDDNLFSDGTVLGRQDDRYKVGLRATWLIDKRWSLNTEFSFTDNDSTIDTYDFQRQLFTTGISLRW